MRTLRRIPTTVLFFGPHGATKRTLWCFVVTASGGAPVAIPECLLLFAYRTVFVAVDTLGNYFWLYACAIEGQQNKVFLVNDPSNGQGILQNPDLMFTVTGGVVNDCAPLALTADGLQALS